MAVERPSSEELENILKTHKLEISLEDRETYQSLIDATLSAYDVVDHLPNHLPEVKYPREMGEAVSSSDNPFNAWYWKSDIQGSKDGSLVGKSIVFKDNIMVAGIPMMNGSSTLEGFVPECDASVVTQVLDAGATVVGKANCEYFCTSGGSHTCANGPVENPLKKGYSAGGSSSGCGALIAAEEVDMAVGTDHGGSCRIPAAFCGVVGLKPTFGLVPCTGLMPIEATIDYIGPITKSVYDNAALLSILAQADGIDPMQPLGMITKDYTKDIKAGCTGLKVAVLREGFGHESSEPEVDSCVREGAEVLRGLGAKVEEVSIPLHREATAIWTPIYLEGLVCSSLFDHGYGKNVEGLYSENLQKKHGNWENETQKFGPQTRLILMVGDYVRQKFKGHFYGKAQNIRRLLRQKYENLLSDYDLILMPTLPMVATPIPKDESNLSEIVGRSLEMAVNTPAADLTGHPSISLPCGYSKGLPVGMMLTGRFFEEETLYRTAYAFEEYLKKN